MKFSYRESLTITNARRMHFNLPRHRHLSILSDRFLFLYLFLFHTSKHIFHTTRPSAYCAWHSASLRVANFKRALDGQRENPSVRHRPPPPQCRILIRKKGDYIIVWQQPYLDVKDENISKAKKNLRYVHCIFSYVCVYVCVRARMCACVRMRTYIYAYI